MFECDHPVTVKAVKSVVGRQPYEPGVVLSDGGDIVLGQSIFNAQIIDRIIAVFYSVNATGGYPEKKCDKEVMFHRCFFT